MVVALDRKVSALHEQAKYYRELARGAVSWTVADQLDGFAAECDREASQLTANQKLRRSPPLV